MPLYDNGTPRSRFTRRAGKTTVSAGIEAQSAEISHIFISEDVPAPEVEVITENGPKITAEPIAESESKKTEVTAEEKTEKPAPTPTEAPKSQTISKSVPASTELKPGDRTVIDGEPHVWIPGFGWIVDEGSDSVCSTVGSPDDQLSGNKCDISVVGAFAKESEKMADQTGKSRQLDLLSASPKPTVHKMSLWESA